MERVVPAGHANRTTCWHGASARLSGRAHSPRWSGSKWISLPV
jgi:hypothetical protein